MSALSSAALSSVLSSTVPSSDVSGEPPLIGLAELIRRAMRGESLAPLAQALKARLAANPDDANAMMDLSAVELMRGSPAARRRLQEQALARRNLFAQNERIPGAPRLLALLAPGDFMANTPVELLLEGRSVNLDFLYVRDESDLVDLPPHDVAYVAAAESRANQKILALIDEAAAHWPCPVLNHPAAIARLTRDGAWRLLRDLDGVFYPENRRLDREATAALTGPFPLIVRPVDSHAGEELEKIEGAPDLGAYLSAHRADAFYVAPFIDYARDDGKYRKIRMAFIDGEAFPIHYAVSSRWMVHYLNADMLHNAEHRAEEEAFMRDFQAFARRHAPALDALKRRLGLDYFQIDCAETADGRLLIFEIGTAMIAHDLDCPTTFPYKSAHMRRLFDAFARMVAARAGQPEARLRL
jgi:glutathione synthase/RimK-type ligase-like ATP-grasp enzyme